MKTKRYILIFLISIAFLLPCSCFFSGVEDTGSIELVFNSTDTKSLKAAGDFYYARVWLLSENNIFSLGDNEYIEVQLESDNNVDLTIENIPAGVTYTLLLATGTASTLDDPLFETIKYGKTEITVAAGVNNAVSLTMLDTPFTIQNTLLGKDMSGAAIVDGSTLYASEGNYIYKFEGLPAITDDTDPVRIPEDYNGIVNSLSAGISFAGTAVLWLNTDNGILPYDGSVFNVDFSANHEGKISILQSGIIDIEIGDDILFFQIDGGLGGVSIDKMSPTNWVDIDLSDIITGQPVHDFIVIDEYGYFATKLGAFRMDDGLISGYDGGETPDYMDYCNFFEIDEGEIPILSIASGSSTRILMATEEGLWYAPLTGTVDVIGQPVRVDGTEGSRFTDIEGSPDGSYAAAVSSSILLLLKADGESYKTTSLYFHSGLPVETDLSEDLSAIVWYGNTLFLTGCRGLVSLDAAALF